MSKYSINDTTLTAIGDAVRAKGGTTNLIKVNKLADAILNLPSGGGGGDIEVEPIVLRSTQNYGCAGDICGAYITLFGDTISTEDLNNITSMFVRNTAEYIPFDLNCSTSTSVSNMPLSNTFHYCSNLKELPKIINLKIGGMNQAFASCYCLREIPEDYCDTWNWEYLDTVSNTYSGSRASLFDGCRSLRKYPNEMLRHANKKYTSSYGYGNVFANCAVLDEIVDLPIIPDTTATSNIFSQAFTSNNRLKRLTFEMQADGSPCVVNWKGQIIDLVGASADGIGYGKSYTLSYNSGITADKEVKDDATYQALKNDPDWFTGKSEYSRYNHDSAVETINSLPDTSAYLATAGGTNTIKFRGIVGSLTDGGAINTLTEAEIAIAAAKGWTVSLT